MSGGFARVDQRGLWREYATAQELIDDVQRDMRGYESEDAMSNCQWCGKEIPWPSVDGIGLIRTAAMTSDDMEEQFCSKAHLLAWLVKDTLDDLKYWHEEADRLRAQRRGL